MLCEIKHATCAAQAIPAFEEAVAGMAGGGLRRIEVPGARPELSYARERSDRFANELFGEGSKYRRAAGSNEGSEKLCLCLSWCWKPGPSLAAYGYCRAPGISPHAQRIFPDS